MSAVTAAAAAGALQSSRSNSNTSSSSMQQQVQYCYYYYGANATKTTSRGSRYEVEKERDWNSFNEYRKNHKPVPLTLRNCRSEHVVEFLDHHQLSSSSSSLDALVGRLRVAFEENGGRPSSNPFKAPLVGLYLRQLRN